jgi:6-phosphogluconolactonase
LGTIRAPFLFRPALHYFPMKITRRMFAFLPLIAPFVFPPAGGSADKTSADHKYRVFVGTYTTKTESKGIYEYEFDADTGKLTPKGVAAETRDPSWVAVHPSGKFLYAANEVGQASTISAFAIDAKSGKLTLLNQLPALGEDPCYLSFDKTGKYVFVANYTSGNVVVFPIGADGKLGAATANVRDEGQLGTNKQRQDGPHAHWIEEHGNAVFVADLGLDRVLLYRFDATKGTLRKASGPDAKHPFVSRDLELSPGTGPRHVAFSYTENSRGLIYVLGELDSTVALFAPTIEGVYSGLAGQKITMLPAGFSSRNDAAEIATHPNGKFLYTSNRGHDSIAVFAIDYASGTLTLAAHVPTGGKEPRHFAIDPSGKYLLAENQKSNNIVVFKIDPATGGLTSAGQVVEVPSPVDMAFLPED